MLCFTPYISRAHCSTAHASSMEHAPVPRVVILPFPAQGHVKPMLALGKLLSAAGVHVTFVNSDHIHDRFRRVTDLAAFSRSFPNLVFESVPEGYPPESPRGVQYLAQQTASIGSVMKRRFRELVVSMRDAKVGPTCIVADGIMMTVAAEAAAELEVPVVAFRTYSACCTWTSLFLPELVEKGEIPVSDEDMDKSVPSFMHGLQGLLRRRDLPSICRILDTNHEILQFYIRETTAMARASALILNTFKELEPTFVTKLASIFPKIYTIGPLHGIMKSRIASLPSLQFSGSIGEEDRSCMTWLDTQPSRSVVYVSFGSFVVMPRHQVSEIWHGVVNSGMPFLWVTRDGVFNDGELVNDEINGRGCVVSWAPQEDVLAHPAIGGFLTHSGWNSTLESINAGVPMICWPFGADQQVNSRCVSELWKVGVDMKDTCHRSIVEAMIKDVMDNKRDEIMRSTTTKIARMANESVKEGGSSYCNLNKLIEDIRSMCSSSIAEK